MNRRNFFTAIAAGVLGAKMKPEKQEAPPEVPACEINGDLVVRGKIYNLPAEPIPPQKESADNYETISTISASTVIIG